jgi:hypothetical protein
MFGMHSHSILSLSGTPHVKCPLTPISASKVCHQQNFLMDLSAFNTDFWYTQGREKCVFLDTGTYHNVHWNTPAVSQFLSHWDRCPFKMGPRVPENYSLFTCRYLMHTLLCFYPQTFSYRSQEPAISLDIGVSFLHIKNCYCVT